MYIVYIYITTNGDGSEPVYIYIYITYTYIFPIIIPYLGGITIQSKLFWGFTKVPYEQRSKPAARRPFLLVGY
jgi:hypothetical protein